jgi:hypothetical protein
MTALHEINQKAQAVLRASLGPVDYARYAQQFSTGTGDYTAERQQRPQESVESISQRVKKLKAEGKLPPPPHGTEVIG